MFLVKCGALFPEHTVFNKTTFKKLTMYQKTGFTKL